MNTNEPVAIDFVRELRLRQWARQHYVVAENRKSTWHPIVLDEMLRHDIESGHFTQTNESSPNLIPDFPVNPL